MIFGEPVLKASGTVPLVARAGSAILPLEDTTSGDPAGEVRVDVALKKRAGREHQSFKADGVTERIAVHTYEAHLTVTTPADTGTASCVAWDVSSHIIIRPPVRGK